MRPLRPILLAAVLCLPPLNASTIGNVPFNWGAWNPSDVPGGLQGQFVLPFPWLLPLSSPAAPSPVTLMGWLLQSLPRQPALTPADLARLFTGPPRSGTEELETAFFAASAGGPPDVQSVPEPGAPLLFVSGIACFVFSLLLRRRLR